MVIHDGEPVVDPRLAANLTAFMARHDQGWRRTRRVSRDVEVVIRFERDGRPVHRLHIGPDWISDGAYRRPLTPESRSMLDQILADVLPDAYSGGAD